MTSHDVQFAQKVRLGSGGRPVIPVEVRTRPGWNPDAAMRIRIVVGEVRLGAMSDGVRRVQALSRTYHRGSASIVDEPIVDRRAEAARDAVEPRETLVRRSARA